MTPSNRNAYHHGDLRRALLDAALARLGDGETGQLKLRALAGDAGVSPTAVYRHFADKEALLAAIATEGFEGLRRETLAGGEGARDPLTRLHGIGCGYVRFAREHPAHYRLMFGPRMLDRQRHPELERAAGASYAVLEDTVREGVDAGVLAPPDVALLSTTAWSLVHGLALLIIDGLIDPDRADDALTQRITGLLATGMESTS
jgi:AcrR family transcriptional regulator